SRERLSAAFAETIGREVDAVAAFGFSPRDIDATVHDGAPPQPILRDAFADAFLPTDENSVASALRWRAGKRASVDFLVAHSRGDDLKDVSPFFGAQFVAPGAESTVMRAGVTRAFSGGKLRLETGMRREKNALLGSVFTGLFGAASGSTTYYQSMLADFGLVSGWRAEGRAAIGFTRSGANGANGFFAGVDKMTVTQFAFGAYRAGVFSKSDRLAFSASRPLRIESGDLHFVVPYRYDLATRSLAYEDRFFGLGGAPREIDIDATYSVATKVGSFDFAVLRQTNVTADGGDAVMGLMRFETSF
ncbi:MAG TPA: hypothetical protein VNH64_05335, partial [Parvularculaceae bacterium]|nr:hypothetical protein [Parvularculaceae bacterium]